MKSKRRKSGACSFAQPIALASLLLAAAGCAPHPAQPPATTADEAGRATAAAQWPAVAEPRHEGEPRAFVASPTAGSLGRDADWSAGGSVAQPFGRDSEPQPPIPPICTLCP